MKIAPHYLYTQHMFLLSGFQETNQVFSSTSEGLRIDIGKLHAISQNNFLWFALAFSNIVTHVWLAINTIKNNKLSLVWINLLCEKNEEWQRPFVAVAWLQWTVWTFCSTGPDNKWTNNIVDLISNLLQHRIKYCYYSTRALNSRNNIKSFFVCFLNTAKLNFIYTEKG